MGVLEVSDKVLILGASGMVGRAIAKEVKSLTPLIPPRGELDLSSEEATLDYFNQHRPTYVFMCAAKVGGIGANQFGADEFFTENIRMQLNFYTALRLFKPKKSLFIASSCMYPHNAPQPLREDQLLTGMFEPTNEGYALAKLAGVYQAKFLLAKHGVLTICPILANIYGPYDYYDEHRSHVVAALIKRFIDAKNQKLPSVTCWGSGLARREFIFVEDVARILVKLMAEYDLSEPINVGTGQDISIMQLAETIKAQVGYAGTIVWDKTKPDGMPVKCMDVSRLKALGISASISLGHGITLAIEDYIGRGDGCL